MFAEDIISFQLCTLHWSYYLVFSLNRLLLCKLVERAFELYGVYLVKLLCRVVAVVFAKVTVACRQHWPITPAPVDCSVNKNVI